MFAQVVTFDEDPTQVQAGIDHVHDDIIPALQNASGLTGAWLVDRAHGTRLSIMIWDSEEAAAAAMSGVQERLTRSKHVRPKPSSIERFEVYATVRPSPSTGEAVARTVMSAIESGDLAEARALIHDDFQFSGPVPQPIGPDAWLGVHGLLNSAMSDFRFNPSGFEQTDDGVRFNVALTMRHTGVLNLTPIGVTGVAATGKSIALPAEQASVTIKDGKLARWSNVTPADGGLVGIASQVGAQG
jgi:hypothetical protein